MATIQPPRRTVLLAFPGVQALDLVGPLEVFRGANRFARREAYAIEVVAPERAPFVSSGGLTVTPDGAARDVRGAIDTLVVCGGNGVAAAAEADGLIDWLRDAAARSRRVTSVCTGAFLLARAGVLAGRRATTHWAFCDALTQQYADVAVEPDAIFVRDGGVWTSAGVTAGMDLALALVEDDLGRDAALQIARWLVLFVQRPGGQSQFSAQLAVQRAQRQPLRDLQAWIADHLDADLRVETLAARSAMSPRNFARAFQAETGSTPAVYVESARVEAARRALERGGETLDAVARACGFGTPETMRRAFHRRVGVGPMAYGARFRRAG